jgi:hypothetical protein
MRLPNNAFEDSTLIVTHADDDIVCFSSILNRLNKIVIIPKAKSEDRAYNKYSMHGLCRCSKLLIDCST